MANQPNEHVAYSNLIPIQHFDLRASEQGDRQEDQDTRPWVVPVFRFCSGFSTTECFFFNENASKEKNASGFKGQQVDLCEILGSWAGNISFKTEVHESWLYTDCTNSMPRSVQENIYHILKEVRTSVSCTLTLLWSCENLYLGQRFLLIFNFLFRKNDKYHSKFLIYLVCKKVSGCT